jgi:Spy/CpxP family protein refolding chaperone
LTFYATDRRFTHLYRGLPSADRTRQLLRIRCLLKRQLPPYLKEIKMRYLRPTLLSLAINLGALAAMPALAAAASPSADLAHSCQQPASAEDTAQRMLQRTDQQVPAVQSVLQKYSPELRDLRQLACENRQAFKAMSASDPKLQELAAAQGKTIADTMVVRKRVRAELDSLLTETQREKFHKMGNRRSRHWSGDQGQGMNG